MIEVMLSKSLCSDILTPVVCASLIRLQNPRSVCQISSRSLLEIGRFSPVDTSVPMIGKGERDSEAAFWKKSGGYPVARDTERSHLAECQRHEGTLFAETIPSFRQQTQSLTRHAYRRTSSICLVLIVDDIMLPCRKVTSLLRATT